LPGYVADQSAERGAQEFELAVVALERLGVGIAPGQAVWIKIGAAAEELLKDQPDGVTSV
jgi:hypothetical protein